MFGKTKCKLCREEVRFALRHLKIKHEEEFEKNRNIEMSKIMEKYFY